MAETSGKGGLGAAMPGLGGGGGMGGMPGLPGGGDIPPELQDLLKKK